MRSTKNNSNGKIGWKTANGKVILYSSFAAEITHPLQTVYYTPLVHTSLYCFDGANNIQRRIAKF